MWQDWPNVEEEQFSPVSVLDCPFKDDDDDDDDDEEISSTPEYCRVHIGGEKYSFYLLVNFILRIVRIYLYRK